MRALLLIFQVVSVSALDGIVPPTGITTAMLGQRQADAVVDDDAGLRIVTRCRGHACVDGLTLNGRVLVKPELDAADAAVYRQGNAWMERVIRVVWPGQGRVSIYVAESEYSGGAHANNSLACRTYDTKTGRMLRLRDVMPAASARRVMTRVGALLSDVNRGIDVLGEIVPEGYSLDERGFRLGRSDSPRGIGPELYLCAEASGPRGGTVLEIRLDAIPTWYLLEDRPPGRVSTP